jgi:hypothetical protein
MRIVTRSFSVFLSRMNSQVHLNTHSYTSCTVSSMWLAWLRYNDYNNYQLTQNTNDDNLLISRLDGCTLLGDAHTNEVQFLSLLCQRPSPEGDGLYEGCKAIVD